MARTTDPIATLARQIKALTYEDMMYVAGWISSWTIYDDNGEQIYEQEDPTLSPESMAGNLFDFAEQNIEGK